MIPAYLMRLSGKVRGCTANMGTTELGTSGFMGPVGIAGTIAFTVYGQLILKWRLEQLEPNTAEQRSVLGTLPHLLDPWVLSGFAGAFIAALCWMVALSRLPLTVAYPFMSVSFVVVLALGGMLLGEHVSGMQWLGVTVVMLGLILGALG